MQKKFKTVLSNALAHGLLLLFLSSPLHGQNKTFIQVKVFDEQLNPLPGLQVSINNNDFMLIDDKGTAFLEVDESDLPPQHILLKDERLEAESWNYSKGILEIIVREKKVQNHMIQLVDLSGKPIANATVTFKGENEVAKTTNEKGFFEVSLRFESPAPKKENFVVRGYLTQKLVFAEDEKKIIVSRIPASKPQKSKKEEILDENYFENFDLKYLDSIQSLTVFYAVFKNYHISNLDDELKQKIDAKFQELINQLQDSAMISEKFIGKISDSSFVTDDLKNLLEQAATENSTLDQLREEFNEKIRVINEKLQQEGQGLDAMAQESLLRDINKLEMILEENEKKFYRNQTGYRTILTSFKEQLLDVKDLERKLYVSETQRVLEKKYFTKQILIVSLFTLVFGLLATLLFYFSSKLQKQRKALVKANEEVSLVNANLENLVAERTKLLVSANQEMDTFLYKASHNLRRPICSIMGLTNVAKHNKDEAILLLEKVEETAREMDGVLGKLLVINEINHPENYSDVDFYAIIEELKKKHACQIEKNKIRWEAEVEEDLNIVSYPQLIRIVLTHLIDNAIFYSVLKEEGQPLVRITVAKKSDRLELVVFDNGTGIDKNIQNDIFKMFFLGNDKSKGNGLGLYIVLKSVEMLKGHVSVHSVQHEFTRFTVRIPVSGTL